MVRSIDLNREPILIKRTGEGVVMIRKILSSGAVFVCAFVFAAVSFAETVQNAQTVLTTQNAVTMQETTFPLYYITFRGGPGWGNKPTLGLPGSRVELSYKTGYMLNFAGGGYVYKYIRLEAEFLYGRLDIDKTKGDLSKNIPEYFRDVGGMVNIFVDVKNSTRFTPFMGAGIGFDYTSMDTITLGTVEIDDYSAIAFAYQFMVGISWSFDPSWAVELLCKFHCTNDKNFDSPSHDNLDLDGLRENLVELGFRCCF